MAQKVVGKMNEANMGSRKTTHGTMSMKSNTKGVSEHGTMGKHSMAPTGKHAKAMSQVMENHSRTGTH